jgi:hypothetical protein
MPAIVRFVFRLVADVLRRRSELVAENALLREQIIAAQRKMEEISRKSGVEMTDNERVCPLFRLFSNDRGAALARLSPPTT